MSETILVTGATGNVGRELVKLLDEQGAPLRAAVVDEADVSRLPRPVSWRRFDFTDAATYREAFAGVEKLFLMRPPHISNIDRDMAPAIRYAAEAGVRRIVFLSLLGAERNSFVPHAKVEKLLQAGSTPYTLLRCGFFMQNLSTTHREDIRRRDELFIPAGEGKTAFIDVRDIAAVAARTLREAGRENQAYPLTGSEALTYYQVAEMMSEVLGRPIAYTNPSPWRFAWRFWRRGRSLSYTAVVTAIYLTTRFGLAETVTPHTADLLQRPPISMRQFIVDYADVWRREETPRPAHRQPEGEDAALA
jgi:uncharacterized protein YbjT (DUF2867 family)